MPKNKIGGKNFKKGKKVSKDNDSSNKILPEADETEFQLYGQVLKKLGGSRISVICSDKIERIGIIPGSFYKKVWLNIGDVLLIQRNPLKDIESFILYKYETSQTHELLKNKKINFVTKDLQADETIIMDTSDNEAQSNNKGDGGFDWDEL